MRTCIGLLTYCDSEKYPKRFEVMKRCIKSLEAIKRDDIYITVWDNNSSEDVLIVDRSYLRYPLRKKRGQDSFNSRWPLIYSRDAKT